jgi:hypothetical protein
MPYLEKAGIHIGSLGDAGEMLDDQAKVAYRRRLSELREGIGRTGRRCAPWASTRWHAWRSRTSGAYGGGSQRHAAAPRRRLVDAHLAATCSHSTAAVRLAWRVQ